MLVLGSHSEEKGNSLEGLTRNLLALLGYQDLTVGAIRMGGQEIDVRGTHPQYLLRNTRSQALICECKAYKNKVDLEAWLKFLGKIYSEEKMLGQEVHGCFVALSGVNGNVAGHYEDLSKKVAGIELIDGSGLEEVLTKHNQIISRDHIQRFVSSCTAHQVIEISLAYLHPSLFWVVRFNNGGYFVLSGQGKICDADTMTKLRPLLEREIPERLYIDIRFDSLAVSNTMMTARTLLGRIIAEGPLQRRDAFEGVHPIAQPQTEFALDYLLNKGLVDEKDHTLILRVDSEDQARYSCSLLLFMLDGRYPVSFLGRGSYDELIDRSLIRLILSMQHVDGLSEDEIEQAITLLKLSPSALLTMIKPCRALHAIQDSQLGYESISKFRKSVFMNLLHQGFLRDFRTPEFIAYFFYVRDIREVQFQLSYTSKSSSKIEHHGSVSDRWATWELDDELYVGYLSSQAAQPWESKTTTQID